jgi:predicted RNase H-like nuclease (RuvC/YqgF family)
MRSKRKTLCALKVLVLSGVIGLLAVGCEENDAAKKMQLQTERQALSVRDVTLENQKLSDQNKKLTTELESVKKTLEAQKAELETLRKEKMLNDAQTLALKARVAELEKEKERLNKLLQESLENLNKLSKELENVKKERGAGTEGGTKSSPPKASPGK